MIKNVVFVISQNQTCITQMNGIITEFVISKQNYFVISLILICDRIALFQFVYAFNIVIMQNGIVLSQGGHEFSDSTT